MESNLYQKIKPLECLRRAREQKTESMDNIAIVIQTSNRVGRLLYDLIIKPNNSWLRSPIGLLSQFLAKRTLEDELTS